MGDFLEIYAFYFKTGTTNAGVYSIKFTGTTGVLLGGGSGAASDVRAILRTTCVVTAVGSSGSLWCDMGWQHNSSLVPNSNTAAVNTTINNAIVFDGSLGSGPSDTLTLEHFKIVLTKNANLTVAP